MIDAPVEQEIKPTVVNPHEFFQNFRQSPRYQKAFVSFYQGKTLAPDVTEKEKQEVFESRSDGAREVFIEYAQHDAHFRYDPSTGFYPSAVIAALSDYVKHVQDTEKAFRKGATQDEIQNLDLLRSRYHTSAAEALTLKGIVPNERFGKAFARLVLIQNGLDTYKNALITDAARMQQQFK